MAEYHCERWGIEIPIDEQRGFCAVQYRKGYDGCALCARGIEVAKEEREMAMCEKKCDTCGNDFTGGPASKTCKKCKGVAVSAEKPQKKDKKPRKNAARTQPADEGYPDLGGNGSHESVMVLETLVAIGAITDAQVEATRKYVQEMFA